MVRLLALAVWSLLLVPTPLAQADAGCQFVLGFATLAAELPQQVGACVDDESHNPANGDALQHTTGGLLVWRKADNWTAFTDGFHTWVNGPQGLQARLNDQRFSWEANPGTLPVVALPPRSVPVMPCATQPNAGPRPLMLGPVTAAGDLSGLAFYSDGGLSVLAPLGWNCAAYIGSAGYQQVLVTPPSIDSRLAILDGTGGTSLATDSVIAQTSGTGASVVRDMACGFFPTANQLVPGGTLANCLSAPGTGWTITPVGQRAVRYAAPTGSRSFAHLGGSVDPTEGAVTFVALPQPVAAMAACTLPSQQAGRCSTVVSEFLYTNGY